MSSSVSKKHALLISINLLWIVLTSLPRLDGYLPAVLSLPLSEILALLLGFVLVACAHALLSVTLGTGKPIDFRTNLAFLVLSSLLMTGVGIHASVVVILSQITPENSVYTLVQHHLHRFWSHNMFQLGYYGLLLLIVLSEVRGYKQQSGVGPSEMKRPPHSVTQTNEPKLMDRIVEWGCSIVMGVFYSKFAVLTVTVPLTVSVYVIVLTALTVWTVRVQYPGGLGVIWHTSRSDLHILGTLAKSCLVGISVLPLHS